MKKYSKIICALSMLMMVTTTVLPVSAQAAGEFKMKKLEWQCDGKWDIIIEKDSKNKIYMMDYDYNGKQDRDDIYKLTWNSKGEQIRKKIKSTKKTSEMMIDRLVKMNKQKEVYSIYDKMKKHGSDDDIFVYVGSNGKVKKSINLSKKKKSILSKKMYPQDKYMIFVLEMIMLIFFFMTKLM